MKNWDTETVIYFAYLLAVVAMITAGLITAIIYETLDKKSKPKNRNKCNSIKKPETTSEG
jgi:predicted outer membrane lipoprotein